MLKDPMSKKRGHPSSKKYTKISLKQYQIAKQMSAKPISATISAFTHSGHAIRLPFQFKKRLINLLVVVFHYRAARNLKGRQM